jgi:hypothetical protein
MKDMEIEMTDELITFKLVWFESEKEDAKANTATGSGYEIKEGGILVFNSKKPIVLSPRMKYVIK